MLDKQLREILKRRKSVMVKGSKVYKNGLLVGARFKDAELTETETIAQIKATFADEGYVKVPKEVQDTWQEYNHMAGFMTGQEWYDRFMKELPKGTSLLIDNEAIEAYVPGAIDLAAKKASGIE